MKLKELDDNLIRKKAIEVCKTITDLGSPYGPNEAFYAGFKQAEKFYLNEIQTLESNIYNLEQKLDRLSLEGGV